VLHPIRTFLRITDDSTVLYGATVVVVDTDSPKPGTMLCRITALPKTARFAEYSRGGRGVLHLSALVYVTPSQCELAINPGGNRDTPASK
jgi:hypothetical protein